MAKIKSVTEDELARLAKCFREASGRSRAEAARELKVSQTSIYQAEEKPLQGLQKLRIRIIETYSEFRVEGPVFFLLKKDLVRNVR